MVIKEIKIRGFKSFGNNTQTIKFNTEKGELALFVGHNGAGKSSFFNSVDYALFGKSRGNRKKNLSQSSLVNRINGELLVEINFESNSTDLIVKRGISPNVLELYENGNILDRAGKVNVEDKIQKYIGMDLETFKSFISMSINDFKNFISLTTEEKKLLLDKLFNLEVINMMNDSLKLLNSENKKLLEISEREIQSYVHSIESIRRNLDKIKKQEIINTQSEIEAIKEKMVPKKEEFEKLREKQTKIKEKEKEIDDRLDNFKSDIINIMNDIRNNQKSIDLFNSGKCPTCQSDLTDSIHTEFLNSMVSKNETLGKSKLEIETSVKDWREKKVKITNIKDESDKLYQEVVFELRQYKAKLEELASKTESNVESESINKFLESISEIESKKDKVVVQSEDCKDKMIYHKELSKIFSDDGVKKIIIKNIISPINYFIEENLKKMNLPFMIRLDDTFDAKVYALGNEIDPETLSTGEQKKVNICILVAYLKLIRTKKSINILFLDEIFSSIDVESIDLILNLLRSFANDYNINIFMVHHSILSPEHFDRILRVQKDIFTTIEEVKHDDAGIFE